MGSLNANEPQFLLRGFFTAFAALCLIAFIIGALYNPSNLKHIRVLTDDCNASVIATSLRDSITCCAEYAPYAYLSLGLCDATFHWTSGFAASHFAWVLPLLPLAATVLADVCSLPDLSSKLFGHFKRLLLYVFIMFFRAYVLYLGAGYVQNSLQELERSDCWYLPLVNYRSCRDNFDFSDHIVLFAVQYGLPCLIELSHVHAFSVDTVGFRYTGTYLLALALLFNAIRGILVTSAFFHTRGESLLAMLISAAVCLPVYYVRGWIWTRTYVPSKATVAAPVM